MTYICLPIFTATASYRLLPEIILLKEFVGRDAHDLKKCFAPGVIEVDNINGETSTRI